jgi:enoyl-CoA hydratase
MLNDIICQKQGPLGHITLNRPQNLNALSHKMALEMERFLRDCEQDDAIKSVLVDAKEDKAFCAGGDLLPFYQQKAKGDFVSGQIFWQDEYRLNDLINRFSKPYIVIMKGFVMGGGVGIAVHGSHRIVTDTTKLSLPECSIGLIPDIGSNYYLAKAPHHLGEFIGLSGYRLNAADAIYSGMADTYVPSTNIPHLVEALIKTGNADIISEFSEPTEPSKLAKIATEIDTVFGQDNLSAIIKTALSSDNETIQKIGKLIAKNSPLALQVAITTLRNIRQNPSVRAALIAEYRFTSRVVEHGDFVEGIRAAIVDKDKAPKWNYATIDDVPQPIVDLFTSEPDAGDLTFYD